MKRFGLIGRTLKHSYSVEIHARFGNPEYELLELEPEDVGPFLRRGGFCGLNVTIPYKCVVMPFCSWISPEARAIGSVNTLLPAEDGLHGYNTDAYGFRFMARRAGIDFHGRFVVIFGSGGASLTARAVAEAEGASRVEVVSRTGRYHYGNLELLRDAQVLVNATPLGMYPRVEGIPADPADFPRCEGVLDMVYNPRRTRFLMAAEKCGIPHSDGLPMLVAQGKKGEELFGKKEIPEEENEMVLAALYRQFENVVLIGMPGSGKSTVGRALAVICGRELVDADERIVEKAGMSIPEIFSRFGEAEFRRLESEALFEAGLTGGKILITGGGAVKTPENYEALHRGGRIYQIERELDKLDTQGRPLSAGADLAAMYREREPLYRRFRDASVRNDAAPEKAAKEIWEDFCEHTGD